MLNRIKKYSKKIYLRILIGMETNTAVTVKSIPKSKKVEQKLIKIENDSFMNNLLKLVGTELDQFKHPLLR